jgi:hypothetical protein
MSSIRIYGFPGVISCLMLLTLSGCAREASDQMSWARAALERNAAIEIVATDPQTHSFTVRDKASGELRVVRADELVGGSAASKSEAAQSTSQAGATAATATAATEAPPASSAWRSDQSATPGSTAGPTQAEAAPARGEMASDGGRVLESGPGYSIKTAAPLPAGARAAGGAGSTAPLERRHDPIVCQGARLLQIDNRNLVFDGDAVSAEDGCEIHITNSRITASGVGVSARAASVYVDNSQIEGDTASIDASQGAQIYAEQSRFRGLSRRLDTATFHDLGGNVWN